MKVKKKNAYTIGIGGLKNGKHQFEIELTSQLLEIFESELMENITGSVILQLVKSETQIDVDLTLNAKVVLLSDRSLREYDYQLEETQKIYFKFSDKFEMLEDDLFKIPFNESDLDFAQIIYDLIAVSLPSKRLHPEEDEDDELFYSSYGEEEYDEESEEEINEEEEGKPTDPRWDILKKLK
ncbi:hypothetical protein AVL50_18130 [Flammeovirga sp. SJP92]|nr:hypothetical protein AVL50_18130 [Flammeovirga sp. SJP92]